MPEILRLATADFVFTVWTKELASSQALIAKTYSERGLEAPNSELRFNPPLLVAKQLLSSKTEDEVLFFENKHYEFEFEFNRPFSEAEQPRLVHRLRNIEDSFHYSRGCLRGMINFGNDIGWFRLAVGYHRDGKPVTQQISFEVQATKMAMSQDLAAIHQDIDRFYPLWRFSFLQKTEQELAPSRKPHEAFELLWLAHFKSLREDLQQAVQRVCYAPHSRLLPQTKSVRAERLRGRLSSRLEQVVSSHLANAESHHYYQQSSRQLSVDTPENRFVKMVLRQSSLRLAQFKQRAQQYNQAPDQARLSTSFLTEIDAWRKPLQQLLNRPLFAEVGDYQGMNSESLVLHQKAGYAAVYRIWQQLKLYLDVFGNHASISVRSVADLYEVWCLLEIRNILFDLGFEEQSNQKAQLITKPFALEKSMQDGMGAAFVLHRHDGVTIRLAHEPTFTRLSENAKFGEIYSTFTTQKPDIFLEASFANGERVQWIFDAKYRLNLDNANGDLAPEDAINQMHRYRDALIYINRANDGEMEKTRPILGAFVLYPGCFDEENCVNPYQKAIDEMAIGGFPLLPSRNNHWLRQFLTARFGNANLHYNIPKPDQYFVEEASRIAPLGMRVERYADLTLAAPLGPKGKRSANYMTAFEQGTAKWYHIPISTTDNKAISRHVMQEVKFCAIGIYQANSTEKPITHLYNVKSVTRVKRYQLTVEQAGIVKNEDDDYWLFEFNYARPLANPLPLAIKGRKFQFQLTNAADLLVAKDWKSLPNRYEILNPEH